MITFPSGNQYKIVYLDTNCINEISKNTNRIGKNFLEKFGMGGYMFATSTYNLFELSKTCGESRKKIIEIFNKIPLAVISTFPQLIEFEKYNNEFRNDMIMLATGAKPVFNIQLEEVLNKFSQDHSLKLSKNMMIKKFNEEAIEWTKHQKKFNWTKNFDEGLIFSMNETFKHYDNYFDITCINKYNSLMILSFIKNQFIYISTKNIQINSVIDAYNCSVLPYVDFYITEKTVGSWINQAKKRFAFLRNKEIITISDLMTRKDD